ncbi:MAG TPA: AMP-binding protein [Candidatus Tectomicrobia bacterium]|nr:AMP-binding protein [Candidatus Tectomicrobia bacterium]
MDQGTIPRLFVTKARHYGSSKVALREKAYGIWQQVTWQQYHEHVCALCLGLMQLGMQRGDRLAIISGNRPEWLYVELAVQSAGAVPVGLFVDSLPHQVKFVLDHAEARFIVAEDQEQVDKILEVRDELPRLERIIVDDARGLEDYRDPVLIGLRQVEDLGRELKAREPHLFDDLIAKGDPSDVALLAYTSGTTGPPKAAMLSHRNLLAMAWGVMQVDPITDRDEMVSFLPFAWVGEQLMSVAIALSAGATVNFPEEPETLREDLREIGPHLLLAPPRVWEAMCSEYQMKIADAGALKRLAARTALWIGYRVAERQLSRRRVGFGRQLLSWVAYLLAFRSLRDKLGLSRLHHAYTGGAPLGLEIFTFFRAIGINLKQVYGQTETSGICVMHPDNEVKGESLGKPTPGTEVRLSDTGEILLRGECVFLGYYKDPEATARALEDGWLHTGDAGLLDEDGHLVMIDRLRDVLSLADGSRFSPAVIENKLKFSPYVREAVVIGEERPYVVALIQIDLANVANWAESNRLPFTTFKDLAGKPEIYGLIAKEVDRVNRDLPKVAQIKRFALFDKELHPDDEELTRTQKVRRAMIGTKYTGMIDALYRPGGA